MADLITKNKVPVCTATLTFESKKFFTNEQLRGFFGYFFLDDHGFHHHGQANAYRYPLVQYKQVENKAMIIGLCEYAEQIQERIPNVNNISVPGHVLKVKEYELRHEDFHIEKKPVKYFFITPWIALNEANYRKMQGLIFGEEKPFLEKILVGNVLSMLKGCGVFVDFMIESNISEVRALKVTSHDNEFKAFRGNFELNISMPDYIGLGKSVSKGFGTIRRVT